MEVFINGYLGLLFAVPLIRGTYQNLKIRHLAVKSLLAMLFVLASSSANLTAYSILDGEMAWLCFTLCTLDTFASATTIFFVSGPILWGDNH